MASLYSIFTIMMVLLAITTITNAFYIDPKDINVDAYCGIAPYPQTIPQIAPLGRAARQLGVKFSDQHVYFRHGDRVPHAVPCFEKMTQWKDMEWEYCPNPMFNFHAGLENREHSPTINADTPPSYHFSVQGLRNKNILNGGCHIGQLSQRGVMMSYNNGMRFAQYLNKTMPTTITPEQFRTRNTDYHRTRETLESFMTGIYDRLPSVIAPKTFTAPTNIPVLTWVDNKVDSLAMNDNMCPTTAYYKKAYADPKWIEYHTNVYTPLEAKVRTLVNDPNAQVYDVYDCAKTLHCHNKPMPDGISELQNELEAANMNYYIQSFQFNHTLANILFTGVWAMDLIPLLTSAQQQTYEDRVFYINSGHDSNVQAYMQLFDFGQNQWPAYSALFQIELYKIAGSKLTTQTQTPTPQVNGDVTLVRFLYDGNVVIPKFCEGKVLADELCHIDLLIAHLSSALPTQGECPNIPRQKIAQFKQQMGFYNDENTNALKLSSDSPLQNASLYTNNQITNFINSMELYFAQQDEAEKITAQLTSNDSTQPLKQRSHHENWAKFNQF